MTSLTEAATPRIVRVAIWLTFLNTWVLFEETVVDRVGLWKYMPFYRVARFCSWDVAATIVISVIVWKAFQRRLRPAPA